MPATKTSAEALDLTIIVKGEVISSTFESFREMTEAQIESINFELSTDADFEQAGQDVKRLKGFEDTLGEKEDEILKSLDGINALILGCRGLKELSRKTRLELDKIVKEKSAEVKFNLLRDGYAALSADCRGFRLKIEESIKGKKSLERMKEAITATVEGINAQVEECRQLIEAAEKKENGAAVTYGRADLLILSPDVVRKELESREERIKSEIEKQRLRDEAERLKKEAEAKAAAEREKLAASTKEAPQADPTPAPASAPDQVEEVQASTAPAAGTSADAELEAFIKTVSSAFAPVKAARNALADPRNIAAAEAFAAAIVPAWKTLNSNLPEA